jgi:spore photoproduct lyase
MLKYEPEIIFIEKKVRDSFIANNILRHWNQVPVEMINGPEEISQDLTGIKALALLYRKGKFIKPCPGTPQHLCCNYLILNIGYNCPLACSYCYLPAYLNIPRNLMVIFANLEDLKTELNFLRVKRSFPILRIGTGEFTDSLVFDHISGFSKELIPIFAQQEGALLELKTKTAQIGHLMELEPRDRVVISWSLNPDRIIAHEESRTASLEQRLTTAQRCQTQGYWIGLHFDPLIYYENWERDYEELIKLTFSRLDPTRILWISLGGLRFIPSLVPQIKQRFPQSKIIYGELFPGRDGKLRYLQKIRVELYSKLAAFIKDFAPQAFIYLCMETPVVWMKALGWSPQSNAQLANSFAEHYSSLNKV